MSQSQIKARMKEIDNRLRILMIEKNYGKSLVKKDQDPNELNQKSFQTRQCPCCGKVITKLCFRCDHTLCLIENCSRKKKQRLNAKMLKKMKQNKGG